MSDFAKKTRANQEAMVKDAIIARLEAENAELREKLVRSAEWVKAENAYSKQQDDELLNAADQRDAALNLLREPQVDKDDPTRLHAMSSDWGSRRDKLLKP